MGGSPLPQEPATRSAAAPPKQTVARKDVPETRPQICIAAVSFTQYPEQDTEKLDDTKAWAQIKAQIEANKQERAEKAAREKALREGAPFPEEPATSSAAAPPKPAVTGNHFPETRLQIHMASGGQPYVTTLSSDASECVLRPDPCLKIYGTSTALREVAEYLAGQVLAVDVETVTFAMNFPRFVARFAFRDVSLH